LFGIVFSFHLESPVLFCQKIPLRVGIILGDGYPPYRCLYPFVEEMEMLAWAN